MIAKPHDLKIDRGADLLLPVTWRQDDGALFNLDGWTGAAQVRASADAPDPPALVLTVTIIASAAATDHNIEVSATAAQTAALDMPRGAWDLKLTAPNGKITRLLMGEVETRDAVTR